MKNILLIVVGFMFLLSAQAAAQDAAPQKLKAPLIEKTQGKINAVTKVDPTKGDFGAFTVVADGEKAKAFKVIAKTRFFSPSAAPIAFTDLKKGDKVTVLFVVTLRGENDVITVTQNK